MMVFFPKIVNDLLFPRKSSIIDIWQDSSRPKMFVKKVFQTPVSESLKERRSATGVFL